MSLFKPRTGDGNFLLSVILTTAKLLFIAILILSVTGAGVLMGVAKAWVETAPQLDLNAFSATAKTSFIYDRNGDLITDFKGSENRIDATWDEIPENLKKAVVAVEDQRFYSHNGVDVKRIFGALVSNLFKDTAQGGSTITQQLVKVSMFSLDPNYKRKLQEAYLALQLERHLTKDQILLAYMNAIFLGGNNYGVKVAAMDYFGKKLSELSLRECAAIAGIIRDPWWYNPRRNYYEKQPPTPEILDKKTDSVLQKMYAQGRVTFEEYNDALNDRLSVLEKSAFPNRMYDNAYYVEYAIYDVVTRMLRMEGLSDNATNRAAMENKLRTGGYRIYTCLDPALQKAVQQTVTDWKDYPTTRQKKDQSTKAPLGNGEFLKVAQPQAAAAVMDWHTGELVAIIGGRAEPTQRKQLNRAYKSPMPVGSSIKPLSVYGPAFDLGNSPGSPVINAPLKIEGWDSVKGYPANFSENGSYNGVESMRLAMVKSHNTAAAQTLFGYVGIENSVNYLQKLGISKANISPTGAGLALGASNPTMIEMAAAFGAIADGGQYLEPYAFTKVIAPDGSVYIDARQSQIRRQVFKESTAFMLVNVLRQCVSDEGTGKRANFGGMTVAGKTGTHSDYRGVSFAGMTGYYSGAVWIGSDTFAPLASNSTGGAYAAPLWAAIMQKVHSMTGATEDRPIMPGSPANYGLVKADACAVSGMKPTRACMHDVNGYGITTDYYLAGTEPTEPCNMHRTIELCARSKKAPGPYCQTVRRYGTIYLPEGHPLRFPPYGDVIEYFKGASTDKVASTIGICDMCGRGGGQGEQNADQLAGATATAESLIARADQRLAEGGLTGAQEKKLTGLRNNTQKAVDNQSLKAIKKYGKQLQQYLKKVR
ncbi:transglycosylase domain-containing protein [Bacillota bacterium Meth-B3]|nr:transglycosylase domain-containing protein [Eubacteriales bacterium]